MSDTSWRYVPGNLLRWPFLGDDGLTPWERWKMARRFDRTIGRRPTAEEVRRLRERTAHWTRCEATNDDGLRCSIISDSPHPRHLFYKRNSEGKVERA